MDNMPREGTVVQMGDKWVLFPLGIKVIPEAGRYSHRNGETEPPTEQGRYWFDGKVDCDSYRGLVVVGTEYEDVQVWPDTYMGWNSTCGFEFEGQWWGPIEPPWEQNV